MSSLSKNRQRAAANNNCREIVAYFDLEKYTKASPEMKEFIVAFERIREGGCKCGNPNPTQRYVACGSHLACEECYQDKDKVIDRRGNCKFPGCHCVVSWPPVRVQAFERMQCAAVDALEKLEHALQIDEQKDDEGARRRAAALGREIEEEEDPEPMGGGGIRLVAPRRGPKRKSDYSEEEWAEIAEERAAKKRQKAEDARKIAEFPEMEAELLRLRELLEGAGVEY